MNQFQMYIVIASQWIANIVSFFDGFADDRIKISTKTNVGKFLQAITQSVGSDLAVCGIIRVSMARVGQI